MARILLVDDETEPVEELVSGLRKQGHHVVHEPNISAAQKAIAGADRYDVAIVDIMVPILMRRESAAISCMTAEREVRESERGGVQFYRMLKQHYPDVKIIIHSVYDKDEIEKRNPKVTLDCPVVQKETIPTTILNAVQRALSDQ